MRWPAPRCGILRPRALQLWGELAVTTTTRVELYHGSLDQKAMRSSCHIPPCFTGFGSDLSFGFGISFGSGLNFGFGSNLGGLGFGSALPWCTWQLH